MTIPFKENGKVNPRKNGSGKAFVSEKHLTEDALQYAIGLTDDTLQRTLIEEITGFNYRTLDRLKKAHGVTKGRMRGPKRRASAHYSPFNSQNLNRK